MIAILHHGNAVHDDVNDPRWILMRLLFEPDELERAWQLDDSAPRRPRIIPDNVFGVAGMRVRLERIAA